MRSRWALLILVLAVIGMVVGANAVRRTILHQPLFEADNIGLGGIYDLNQPLRGDLAVLAEQIILHENSAVSGDAALVGGWMSIAGRVGGDVTALGESFAMQPGAHIHGNLTLLVGAAVIDGRIDGELNIRGDQVTIRPDAHIGGLVYACGDTLLDERAAAPPHRPCSQSALLADLEPLQALRHAAPGELALGLLMGASLLMSLSFSGLAALGVVVFPRQISHIEQAIRSNPRSAGARGLMLLLLLGGITSVLLVLLARATPLGLLLIPVYFVLGLVFLGMTLAGWVTVALLVGDVLLGWLTRAALPPLMIALVGNVALVVGLHIAARLWLPAALALLLLLAIVGLGGAFSTRLGTRPVHRSYLVQG
jgi:hypothetical protein